VTAAEALGNPHFVHRVAGTAEVSPTTVRAVLHGRAPGRVRAPFLRVWAVLAREGVELPSTASAGHLQVVG
jgi:hypothetical protein